MDILFLLVPLSVVLAFVIVGVFYLSLAGGQFDDLDQQSGSVLDDDDSVVTGRPLR